MNYSQLNPFDTMNGDGIRVSLFVSGCSLNCPGCHNKEAQNYKYGKGFSCFDYQVLRAAVMHPSIAGLSILGGEPLAAKNRDTVMDICACLKEDAPSKTIWLWSGYTLAEIQESSHEILEYIDVLIDGRFVQELADPNLQFRGSSNQKIYDIQHGVPHERLV